MTAGGLARLFRDNIWKLYSLPESIISNKGPQFAAGVMRELNTMLGIDSKLSTVFYPQTDGQTERMNQELEQYYGCSSIIIRNSGQNGWELQNLPTIIKYRQVQRYHLLRQTADKILTWDSNSGKRGSLRRRANL